VVLEIGAGTGRLTEALAGTGAQVVAVELDARSIEVLQRRFDGASNVAVVQEDVLRFRPPVSAYRAFGNIPFAITTPILGRLLDDPAGPVQRADLIVQYDVARKRSSIWPSNLLSLGWLPWWEVHLARRLPAAAFEPRPSVDAGVLSMTRREPPLLPADVRREYLSLVGAAFRRANVPVGRALGGRVPKDVWRRLARERGDVHGLRPSEVDVFTWVAVFRATRGPQR
jgi:23S rRNA (adenine-N6)-dimethyltransferase